MATVTASAPKTIPYMDELIRIAVGEANAYRSLTAWADVTADPELACTLRLVAARENNHAQVFKQLVAELGGEVCCTPDRAAYARLAVAANPALSDADKIQPLGDDDPFVSLKRRLADGVYDAATANHMTWWIAEECDSLARLRAAFAAVHAKANGAETEACTNGCATAAPSADAQAIMACMTEGFGRLEQSLEKLARAAK
jgi:hypothetical protein